MKKYIFSVILFVSLILAVNTTCNAASAKIVCADSGEVDKSINISVTGAAAQWNLTLKVNGETIAQSNELDNVDGNKNISFSGNYTPKKDGTLNVTLVGSVTEYSDGSTIKSFQPKSISIAKKEIISENTTNNETQNNNEQANNNQATVKEEQTSKAEEAVKEEQSNKEDATINKEQTNDNEKSENKTTITSTSNQNTPVVKSSNANLSDLGIRPNDFKGFKPGTTSYDVTVPNNVEKIEVYAKTQDSNAKVTVKGNRNLSVGNNVFDIIVTAEDGTKKTYTINVTREENAKKEETTSNETVESTTKEEKNVTSQTTEQTEKETNQTTAVEKINADLKKLEVTGYTITPKFDANVYEYKLTIPADISNLDVKAEATNTNVKIEVAGNKELKDGENVITIVCYNNETKKTSTYQIIVTKQTAENSHAEAINEALKKRNLIIKVGVAIVIVLIILCIIVFKKGRDEFEETEVEDESPRKKESKNLRTEKEEKSNEMFKEISEKRKVSKENQDIDKVDTKQISQNNGDGNETRNRISRGYSDEEIAQIRQRRIAERENKARRESQITNNEDLPKSLQKDTSKELSMVNAKKTQKERDDEFDEKLYRIRQEKRKQLKGGKHF